MAIQPSNRGLILRPVKHQVLAPGNARPNLDFKLDYSAWGPRDLAVTSGRLIRVRAAKLLAATPTAMPDPCRRQALDLESPN